MTYFVYLVTLCSCKSFFYATIYAYSTPAGDFQIAVPVAIFSGRFAAQFGSPLVVFFGCSISVPRRPRNPLAERTPGGWDNFSLRLIYAVSTPILRQNHGSILVFFGGAFFGFFWGDAGPQNAPKSRERRGDLFKPFFRLMCFLSTPQSTPILRLIYA